MNILICNYEYPPIGGGGGIITSLIAEELAKDHEVTVLTSRWHSVPTEYTDNGVRIVRVPVLFRNKKYTASLISLLTFIPFAIHKGKKLINQYSFDLINTHFVLPTGPVGDKLSRLYSIPNVLTLHGGDIYDPTKLFSPHRNVLLSCWTKHLLQRADAIIGNSNNTLRNMQKHYDTQLQGHKIALGIKNLDVQPASRRSFGLTNNDIIFVTIGRLIPRKNNLQLIRIMHDILNENVKLIIIGAGPEENLLKQECSKRNLNNRITFTGHVGEVEKYKVLKMSDIFVSASKHEGFGLVFIEAMQNGLPVVCYNNGGQVEYLENEKTGFLITTGDTEQFKKSCSALVKNPELRKKIGRFNLSVSKQYSAGRCASEYEDMFLEIINKKNDLSEEVK